MNPISTKWILEPFPHVHKHDDNTGRILDITSKAFPFPDSVQIHSSLESAHECLAPKRFYYTGTVMVNSMCQLARLWCPFCLVKHRCRCCWDLFFKCD